MSDLKIFFVFICDGAVRRNGKCGGKREEIADAPPHFPFLHTAPSQRKNKENVQNLSYHMIIAERNKNGSRSIICEGNDRILLSEDSL